MTRARRVLIDATPLRALSGLRGIGRYLRDLLIGLSRVAPDAAPELSLSALTHLRPGDVRRSSDLLAVAEESVGEANTFDGTLFACRRTMLGPVARLHGAELLHLPEVRGTPLPPRVPFVATCHDLIPLIYPDTYFGWRLDLPLTDEDVVISAPGRAYAHVKAARRFRLAKRVICISQRTADDVHELLGVPRKRLDVVPSGVDIARYQRASARAPRAGSTPFALYVGYCDARKNIQRMFEAIRLANETAPLELRWAGDIRGADLENMKRLAHELGVQDHVKFLGFVDDATLVELYRDAVALLFLSRLEGFGLPVLEAMAAGCPTIVARHSASDEVCADTGLIVDPDDVKSAAEALVRLAADPLERRLRGDRGAERAQLYRCETMARGHLASYQRALTPRR
jgi:glycosyltransferase involved in cell wall biosynthesis